MAPAGSEREVVEQYHAQLLQKRLIDFDMVLSIAYQLLQKQPEIPKTLAAIIKLLCIDEYQDTQDLQYGILSAIVRASHNATRVFVVGDKDQAIYTSLGGIAKTLDEVKVEFGLAVLQHYELSGNYRSTQRIVDFSSHFQDGDYQIKSRAEYAEEYGTITFNNRDVHKDALAERIASLVTWHLDAGVSANEICILAPTWRLITSLGRKLIGLLPTVDLDAPGLSPLRYQRDSVWFKLARLFLSDPIPARYRTRLRWAADFVHAFEQELGHELDDNQREPRRILRSCNSIQSDVKEGIAYLEDVFSQFITAMEVEIGQYPTLLLSWNGFFDGARDRLDNAGYDLDIDVESPKKMFRHPAGLVVNTCHGVKGEEYTVVICFGVLRGNIPHWQRIYDDDTDEREDARRLLFVISSRARKHLHLFAEDGRRTKSGYDYETTKELEESDFEYDGLPG